MNSLNTPVREARAQRVAVTEDSLVVGLTDGRSVTAPLVWYPRLLNGTSGERNNWRLVADGEGIHWPDLDEYLSVESIVMGRASGESQASLKRWLESRQAAPRSQVKIQSPVDTRRATHGPTDLTRLHSHAA